ncbi:MAG: hypothetical protein WDZ59_06375 [Pirellulales bacterium]
MLIVTSDRAPLKPLTISLRGFNVISPLKLPTVPLGSSTNSPP